MFCMAKCTTHHPLVVVVVRLFENSFVFPFTAPLRQMLRPRCYWSDVQRQHDWKLSTCPPPQADEVGFVLLLHLMGTPRVDECFVFSVEKTNNPLISGYCRHDLSVCCLHKLLSINPERLKTAPRRCMECGYTRLRTQAFHLISLFSEIVFLSTIHGF